MRESTIENYLVKQVKRHGGVAEKFVSPGKRGVPDRIVSWPFRFKDWVECKATDGRLSVHQKRDHKRRRKMGDEVVVVWSKAQVDSYVARARYRHRKALIGDLE